MTAPVLDPLVLDPADEPIHLICCNPNFAACGTEAVAGPIDVDIEPTCALCELIDNEDLPCSDPECDWRDDVVVDEGWRVER